MKRIILSGSKGFLGSHVKELLGDNNNYVLIKEIDVANGNDLCDASVSEQLSEFDCFIHLANLVYVPDSYLYPDRFYRINYLTTLNALEACRKNKAHLIYISSYIYGQPQSLPVDESHVINPFNPYAQTKCICETLCEGYHRDFGVDVTILRPFNIYGAGQKGKLLIPEIISQLKDGKKNIQLRAASPRRDYVNVVDVAKAIVRAVDDEKGYNIYNVCSGTSVSVKELTELINISLKNQVVFSFSDSDRPNEVDETVGSFAKIEKHLGWKPLITIEEGIKQIVTKENL